MLAAAARSIAVPTMRCFYEASPSASLTSAGDLCHAGWILINLNSSWSSNDATQTQLLRSSISLCHADIISMEPEDIVVILRSQQDASFATFIMSCEGP